MAWPGIDHWRETEYAKELIADVVEELERLAQAGLEIGPTAVLIRGSPPSTMLRSRTSSELTSGHRASPGRSLSVSRLSVRGSPMPPASFAAASRTGYESAGPSPPG